MSKPVAPALAVAFILFAAGCAKNAPAPAASASPAATMTEEQKTLYAAGLILGRNLEPMALTPAEIEIVAKGIADAATGKPPQVELQTYGPKVQEFLQARQAARAGGEKTKGQDFAAKAAGESGAEKTASGLVYQSLTAGAGASPKATDTVKVHYRGTLTDGKEFDSSYKRGEPVEFPLNGVIPCWTEGVQKMKVGGKARLVCPSTIAYGDQGRPPVIPGGATLVFEVELLEIKK
jgi:FKBP-type peptidyl-prolyl cis-trans isomerase FkpA